MNHEVTGARRSASDVPVCPSFSRWDGDLVGCGSRNVAWDEMDKVFDCYNCGLFFDREQAFLTRELQEEHRDEQAFRHQAQELRNP